MNEKVRALEDKQISAIQNAHRKVGGIGMGRDRLTQMSVLGFIQHCTVNGLILIPHVLEEYEIMALQTSLDDLE